VVREHEMMIVDVSLCSLFFFPLVCAFFLVRL
jgi:hypothetical protein